LCGATSAPRLRIGLSRRTAARAPREGASVAGAAPRSARAPLGTAPLGGAQRGFGRRAPRCPSLRCSAFWTCLAACRATPHMLARRAIGRSAEVPLMAAAAAATIACTTRRQRQIHSRRRRRRRQTLLRGRLGCGRKRRTSRGAWICRRTNFEITLRSLLRGPTLTSCEPVTSSGRAVDAALWVRGCGLGASDAREVANRPREPRHDQRLRRTCLADTCDRGHSGHRYSALLEAAAPCTLWVGPNAHRRGKPCDGALWQ